MILVLEMLGWPARCLVRWIGRNTVSTKFADPLRVLPTASKPVRWRITCQCVICSFQPNMEHWFYDALIQAGALVNGLWICGRSNVAETFVYYHIELAEHALVWVEGTPPKGFRAQDRPHGVRQLGRA